jgi:rod shape-determining protein MreB
MQQLVESMQAVIEATPPELVADIMKRGVVLCGGGALLKGIDMYLQQGTGIPVKLTEDPLTAVVRGIGLVLGDVPHYKSFIHNL